MKKRYLFILLALLVLVVPGLTSCGGYSAASSDSEAKAAIIDQLYCLDPNQALINETTDILEAYGFEVDVWQGEEVTVNLYRELPKYGYKLIIFRAHSGIMYYLGEGQVITKETTYLFTGEAYTTTDHIKEQLAERVQNAQMTEDYPLVFAINSRFIAASMDGRFDNTAIIMTGCSTTYLDDMAAAFTAKGASVYLGWNVSVGLDYVDGAALNLIDNLCIKDMTIESAVKQTMAEAGVDPYYLACLNYYPPENGNQTIKELIK